MQNISYYVIGAFYLVDKIFQSLSPWRIVTKASVTGAEWSGKKVERCLCDLGRALCPAGGFFLSVLRVGASLCLLGLAVL